MKSRGFRLLPAVMLMIILPVFSQSIEESGSQSVGGEVTSALDSLVMLLIDDVVDWGDGAPHLQGELPEIGWEESLVDAVLTEDSVERMLIDLAGLFCPGAEGSFVRPVYGVITSHYGWRPSFGRMHKGIDLAISEGETIRAALGGKVGRVAFDPGGYGNYIVLIHSNGLETRYAHLSHTLVVPGQRVSAGAPIGVGGTTGNATGPCLHFEARRYGIPQNPLSLFPF